MNYSRLGILVVTTATLLNGCIEDNGAGLVSRATTYEESTVEVIDGEGETTLVTVTDRGEGTGTVTWTNDKTYELDGFVFVNAGQTLTIDPGTVIWGKDGNGPGSSALVVARGGTIIAEGTAERPIIFTSEADNTYSTPAGLVQGTNLDPNNVALWGGLIVLGEASLNSTPGESAIEGIASTESRGLYGGNNDADDSGVLRYVSIRHGGTEIGAGNEINGLTFGGVGSGTTVEYVEVFGNKDDGIEFFGGTVNTKYVVSAYCQDDAFDYDEGYRGKNQFWLAIQRGTSDRGGEHDGGTDPETARPYATPTIANATFSGIGGESRKRTITFRDNAGGKYFNSVFTGYGRGVDVEYISADDEDSYARLVAGDLAFANNLLWDVTEAPFVLTDADDEDELEVPQADRDFATAYFTDNGNTADVDPGFAGDGLTPAKGGAAQSNLFEELDDFFTPVDYKGAIDPDEGPSWIANWTRVSREIN